MKEKSRVAISIVSHGHGEMLQRLLTQIATFENSGVVRVIITFNIPENICIIHSPDWSFEVEYINNKVPLGFGANHNNALKDAEEDFFCILNPDVEFIPDENPFSPIDQKHSENLACIYPVQINECNLVQESERELPTPWALFRRRILRKKQRCVDWVNGAFLLIPNSKWRAVGGFDDKYFMYCEDVDLSIRLKIQGGVFLRTNARVIHPGQRASSRQWKHLTWHVKSLFRLWLSEAFWNYLINHRVERSFIKRHPR